MPCPGSVRQVRAGLTGRSERQLYPVTREVAMLADQSSAAACSTCTQMSELPRDVGRSPCPRRGTGTGFDSQTRLITRNSKNARTAATRRLIVAVPHCEA